MTDEKQQVPDYTKDLHAFLTELEEQAPPSRTEKIGQVHSELALLKYEQYTESTHALCIEAETFARRISYTYAGVKRPAYFKAEHPIPEINTILDSYRDRLSDMEEGFIVRFDYHLAVRLLIAGWDFSRTITAIAEVNADVHQGTSSEYRFYAKRVVNAVYKNPAVRQAITLMAHWKQENGIPQEETSLKKLRMNYLA